MTVPRPIPQPDMVITIVVPAPGGASGRRISRRIANLRDLGNGRYACLLRDPASGGYESVTIAPEVGGDWLCVEPPVDIQAAVHMARRVEAGDALQSGVHDALHLLARAVNLLTGNARAAGPAVPARIDGGRA